MSNLTISGLISGSGALVLAPASDHQGSTTAATALDTVSTPGIVTISNSGNSFSGGLTFGATGPTGGAETNTNAALNTLYPYTGTTEGELVIANGAALGTGPFTDQSGALLDNGSSAVTITNPVFFDTGAEVRTVVATTPGLPFTFSGVVSSTAALAGSANTGFTKAGPGTVDFTGPISLDNSVTVGQGTMDLSGGGSLFATGLTVGTTSTLLVDNTTVNNANRLSAAMPITLSGGTISYLGSNTAGLTSTQTLGPVTLEPGYSTIISTSGSGIASGVVLTLTSLTRQTVATVGTTTTALTGAFLNLVGVGTNIGSPTNQIIIPTAGSITPEITQVNNYVGGSFDGDAYILPYATVTSITGGVDFVETANGTAGNFTAQPPFSLQAFTGYATVTPGSTLANAVAGDVVKLPANYSETLATGSGTAALGGLILAGDNISINGGGTLNIGIAGLSTAGQGAIVSTGATSTGDTIGVATLTFANGDEGILDSLSSPGLNVTSAINGAGGLTIAGTGTTNLGGTNTSETGNTILTAGTLVLSNASAINPGTAQVLAITGGTLESGIPGTVTAGGVVTNGLTFVNPIQLYLGYVNNAVTFAGPNPLTLGAVISTPAAGAAGAAIPNFVGPGGITVNSTSALVYTQSTANLYTGTTTVNAGTLLLSKSAARLLLVPW